MEIFRSFFLDFSRSSTKICPVFYPGFVWLFLLFQPKLLLGFQLVIFTGFLSEPFPKCFQSFSLGFFRRFFQNSSKVPNFSQCLFFLEFIKESREFFLEFSKLFFNSGLLWEFFPRFHPEILSGFASRVPFEICPVFLPGFFLVMPGISIRVPVRISAKIFHGFFSSSFLKFFQSLSLDSFKRSF